MLVASERMSGGSAVKESKPAALVAVCGSGSGGVVDYQQCNKLVAMSIKMDNKGVACSIAGHIRIQPHWRWLAGQPELVHHRNGLQLSQF